MAIPELKTERLLLRGLRSDDVDAAYAMYADPQVTRFLHWQCPELDAYRPLFEDAIRRHREQPPGQGVWGGFDRKTGLLCGVFILKPVEGREETEIGYHLARAAWGMGLATEGARRLLRHAFDTVGLSRVVCLIHPGNRASIRVAERLGLERAGEDAVDGVPCLRFEARPARS